MYSTGARSCLAAWSQRFDVLGVARPVTGRGPSTSCSNRAAVCAGSASETDPRTAARRRAERSVEWRAKLLLGLGQQDRAVGGDAVAERHLVVVHVLAAALDDRGTTIGILPRDAASMMVPGPPWQTTTLASRTIASISAYPRYGLCSARWGTRGAGLHEAACGRGRRRLEPGVDPVGHPVERMVRRYQRWRRRVAASVTQEHAS